MQSFYPIQTSQKVDFYDYLYALRVEEFFQENQKNSWIQRFCEMYLKVLAGKLAKTKAPMLTRNSEELKHTLDPNIGANQTKIEDPENGPERFFFELLRTALMQLLTNASGASDETGWCIRKKFCQRERYSYIINETKLATEYKREENQEEIKITIKKNIRKNYQPKSNRALFLQCKHSIHLILQRVTRLLLDFTSNNPEESPFISKILNGLSNEERQNFCAFLKNMTSGKILKKICSFNFFLKNYRSEGNLHLEVVLQFLDYENKDFKAFIQRRNKSNKDTLALEVLRSPCNMLYIRNFFVKLKNDLVNHS